MTRLTEANTSAEIGLSRYFRPYTEKRDLLVLVEGDDDVFFWKRYWNTPKTNMPESTYIR